MNDFEAAERLADAQMERAGASGLSASTQDWLTLGTVRVSIALQQTALSGFALDRVEAPAALALLFRNLREVIDTCEQQALAATKGTTA